MRILITGSNGFIGSNLVRRLESGNTCVLRTFNRGNSQHDLGHLVSEADTICHLAGVNRPLNRAAFYENNTRLTEKLCDAIRLAHDVDGKIRTLVYSSSTHISNKSEYGESKLRAFTAVQDLQEARRIVYHLPGVFGPGQRPFYNSVVATFCFSAVNNLPLTIVEGNKSLRLNFVADVVESMIENFSSTHNGILIAEVLPVYQTSVNELANMISRIALEEVEGPHHAIGKRLEDRLRLTVQWFLAQKLIPNG